MFACPEGLLACDMVDIGALNDFKEGRWLLLERGCVLLASMGMPWVKRHQWLMEAAVMLHDL